MATQPRFGLRNTGQGKKPMKVEMDEVIEEYVKLMLWTVFLGPDPLMNIISENDHSREHAVMDILESMVAHGEAESRFDLSRDAVPGDALS
jgi:hypothetical protein